MMEDVFSELRLQYVDRQKVDHPKEQLMKAPERISSARSPQHFL
jgi:hypothetical protein